MPTAVLARVAQWIRASVFGTEGRGFESLRGYHYMIKLKRVYETAGKDDGFRVLVDRLWPRGVSKDKARIDLWLKEIGPTTELRKWFGHDPAKWEEFSARYRSELETNPAVKHLRQVIASHSIVTLVFGAADTNHTHALVLKDFLETN